MGRIICRYRELDEKLEKLYEDYAEDYEEEIEEMACEDGKAIMSDVSIDIKLLGLRFRNFVYLQKNEEGEFEADWDGMACFELSEDNFLYSEQGASIESMLINYGQYHMTPSSVPDTAICVINYKNEKSQCMDGQARMLTFESRNTESADLDSLDIAN